MPLFWFAWGSVPLPPCASISSPGPGEADPALGSCDFQAWETHKVPLVLCEGGCQQRARGPAHGYPRDTAFTEITREQKGPFFGGQRGSKRVPAGTEPPLWERIASVVRQPHYLQSVLQSFLLAEPPRPEHNRRAVTHPLPLWGKLRPVQSQAGPQATR